jgi:hypothetical protein
MLAHRAVWEVSNGPICDDTLICHRCDNPRCVNPDHLFAGTVADNVLDRVTKGRSRSRPPQGEQHPNARITADDVRMIRSLYATGQHSLQALGTVYGVSNNRIRAIVKRKAWKHIE